MTETYEVLALRYAWRDARRRDHFRGEVPDPDASMPMDYFVWVMRNSERTVLLDTGFKPDVSARRGRTHLRMPADALRMTGIDPASISDVIVSHMHYDHAGTIDSFPNARLHLQDLELEFVTSEENRLSRGAFEVDDVCEVLRRLYADGVSLYQGSAAPWPGINLHLVGGHTPGMQVVQVRTKRGWLVLAADASHFFENMERGIPFSGTHDIDKGVAAFDTLRALADSAEHVIPGHDPEVVRRYAGVAPELDGIAIRLDEPPRE